VAVLRGRPWRRVSQLRVPSGPHNVAASSDGRFVAVSSPTADAVTIIDARTARVRARVRVAGRPHDVDFSADGRFVWVTAEGRSRLVLVSVMGEELFARCVRAALLTTSPSTRAAASSG
jgi:DNA-binding beta-propeller fold protein YncE